jgi:hypothetical protein
MNRSRGGKERRRGSCSDEGNDRTSFLTCCRDNLIKQLVAHCAGEAEPRSCGASYTAAA